MSDKMQPQFVHYTLIGSNLVHMAYCGRTRVVVTDIGPCNFWRLCEFLGCNPFYGSFFYHGLDVTNDKKPHGDYKQITEFLLSPLPYHALARRAGAL